MVAIANKTYNVGGVLLERPFKVRRLGHVGFSFTNFEACLRFYHDLLGFRVSDTIDWGKRAPEKVAGLGDANTYFTRYAGDHHSFVFGSRAVRDAVRPGADPMMNIGQISWQVDTLGEVVNAYHWLKDRGEHINRVGRDMPGSNWHTYFNDHEGHNNELFYGMEQIGWDGVTKSLPMYRDRFAEEMPLPQRSEDQELQDSLRDGIDIFAGRRDPEAGPAEYDVDGVQLQRPFRVTRIGPIGLFVNDLADALAFYTGAMGFTLTETVSIQGQQAHFLRASDEHHSLALYPTALKAKLGIIPQSTCAVMGFQVGSYKQLRNAVEFLKAHEVPVFEAPPAFHTGIDYAAHFLDPDGHVVRLYHAIERVGWDGQPKPAALRHQTPLSQWPEALADGPGAYAADIFQGPLG